MADTVYKLTHTGEQIDSAIDNAVRSDAQTLTMAQQTQARTNIDAASTAAMTTETNARTAADTGVRGLTATVEATSTASKAYAIGAYFVYNGLLYKCTAAIAQGGTITPGTNCTATTAGAEISTLNQNLMPTYAAQTEVYPVTTGATQSYTTPEKGWYAIFTSDTGTAVLGALSCYVGACLVSYWVYSDPYSGASTVLPIPANTVIRIEGRATSRMRIYKLS